MLASLAKRKTNERTNEWTKKNTQQLESIGLLRLNRSSNFLVCILIPSHTMRTTTTKKIATIEESMRVPFSLSSCLATPPPPSFSSPQIYHSLVWPSRTIHNILWKKNQHTHTHHIYTMAINNHLIRFMCIFDFWLLSFALAHIR